MMRSFVRSCLIILVLLVPTLLSCVDEPRPIEVSASQLINEVDKYPSGAYLRIPESELLELKSGNIAELRIAPKGEIHNGTCNSVLLVKYCGAPDAKVGDTVDVIGHLYKPGTAINGCMFYVEAQSVKRSMRASPELTKILGPKPADASTAVNRIIEDLSLKSRY